MKKGLVRRLFVPLAAFASLFTFALATPVSAQLKSTQTQGILKNVESTASGSYDIEQRSLPELIGSVIGNFLALLGAAFVILMIYGGYLYMTAQGNEDQVEKGKDVIKNAVVGIVIIFLAYAITNAVVDALVTQ